MRTIAFACRICQFRPRVQGHQKTRDSNGNKLQLESVLLLQRVEGIRPPSSKQFNNAGDRETSSSRERHGCESISLKRAPHQTFGAIIHPTLAGQRFFHTWSGPKTVATLNVKKPQRGSFCRQCIGTCLLSSDGCDTLLN
mmetsp:Transcript_18247/g.34851  ORF Transcript_18247/g.34851 Transcript_18247/m.34851 type:complete len:140 (+) Transcript_18247:97-516(+)